VVRKCKVASREAKVAAVRVPGQTGMAECVLVDNAHCKLPVRMRSRGCDQCVDFRQRQSSICLTVTVNVCAQRVRVPRASTQRNVRTICALKCGKEEGAQTRVLHDAAVVQLSAKRGLPTTVQQRFVVARVRCGRIRKGGAVP